MKNINIGTIDGHPLTLDIDRLIESKLLIQANSGGGKSNTIRLLAEKVAPVVPFVILDPEGEFSTLREKADLVLVGEGGELETSVKNAGELALKLLSLGVSAVVDLFQLTPRDRRLWVARYCENLLAAPKSLWRPFVLFIDEADMFAPEKTDSEARDAVIRVMTLSRKRDICPILATQRLASLSTDARAAVNNFLIGRATLDNDYKRAGEILGMPPHDRRALAQLKRGTFYSFGPAFKHDGVGLASIDRAETKPPKTGQGVRAAPSPSAAIQALIPELAQISTESNPDEVSTIDKARERIKELGRELAQAKKAASKPAESVADPKAIERAVLERDRHWRGELKKWEDAAKGLAGRMGKIANLAHVNGEMPKGIDLPPPVAASRAQIQRPTQSGAVRSIPASTPSTLPIGERLTLAALIQYPDGLRRNQLTVLTGYKRSTRDAYIQRLREKGYCEVSGDTVTATPEGCAALPDAEPLPTGKDLQAYWMERLPEGERAVLQCLIEGYPGHVERDAITEATGYKRSTRDAYLQRLSAKELATTERGEVRASDSLFEVRS